MLYRDTATAVLHVLQLQPVCCIVLLLLLLLLLLMSVYLLQQYL